MRYISILRANLLLAAAVCLSACAAGVTATKVTPGRNPKGIHVHLPAPFLVGKPNPSGTIEWKIEYLPDPDEEYAVHAWSLLSKNNSEFTRTKAGLLSKAKLTMDSTVVAKSLIEKAGTVGDEALKTAVAQKKAAADAAAAKEKASADTANAAKSAKSAVVAATKNVEQRRRRYALVMAKAQGREDAEKDLAVKAAELTAAEKRKDDAGANEKAGAQKDVDAAKTAKAAAEERLRLIKEAEDALPGVEREVTEAAAALISAEEASKLAEAARQDAANAVGQDNTAAVDVRTITQVPGPVIYRILENAQTGGIRLERVRFELFGFNGQLVSKPFSQGSAGSWGTKKKAE